MKNSVQKRNHSLDVIRIVAILAVIMTHCSAPFVTNYAPHTLEFVFGNFFDSISRMGVPLFLMISGSLFLDEHKEITLNGILSKNVKNLAAITLIWAILYATAYHVLSPLVKGNPIHVKTAVVAMIKGHGHMWYLYMIMGIYIATPILKKFVCKENEKTVLSFIAISFIVQFVLPMADKILAQYSDIDFIGPWVDQFHLDFFSGYITYFLTGWYIVHIGAKQNRFKAAAYGLGIVSFLFIVLYSQFTGDYKTVYENIGVPVFLYSVGVFLALNSIPFICSDTASKILTVLSRLSFGAYLIHVLVLDVFNKLFSYRGHCVSYIFLCYVTVTCVSFFSVYIMSKIPLIKKLIKM